MARSSSAKRARASIGQVRIGDGDDGRGADGLHGADGGGGLRSRAGRRRSISAVVALMTGPTRSPRSCWSPSGSWWWSAWRCWASWLQRRPRCSPPSTSRPKTVPRPWSSRCAVRGGRRGGGRARRRRHRRGVGRGARGHQHAEADGSGRCGDTDTDGGAAHPGHGPVADAAAERGDGLRRGGCGAMAGLSGSGRRPVGGRRRRLLDGTITTGRRRESPSLQLWGTCESRHGDPVRPSATW